MRFRVVLLLIVMLAASGAIRPVRAQQPDPKPEVAQGYSVDVVFDPNAATIGGEMLVEWTNTTGETQQSLPFRLYPNADHYGEGDITLDAVAVDGVPVAPDVAANDPTVMRVPLGGDVLPDASRSIEFVFTTTIPIDSDGSYGMFRGNSADGSWSLVDWYPIVAAWEPGEGWYLEPPSGSGDPTFVTASSWRVTVSHPASFALVGTGEEATSAGNPAVTTFDLERGREFAMVALPADQVTARSTVAGDTEVEIALLTRDAVPGMIDLLASLTQEAVPSYTAWFGERATAEIDLAGVTLEHALGVSWSGSVWLDLDSISRDGELSAEEREGLRFVLYHELAHQWIANVVGTNSNDHAFLTEGLANTMAIALIRETAGPDAARLAIAGWVAGPYRAWVNRGSDAIADTPARDLEPMEHSLVVYGKAGVGFEAIRQRIGDHAFHDALRRLGTERWWGIATPDDVLAAFEAASGVSLDDLWAFWFEEQAATVERIDAVVEGAG